MFSKSVFLLLTLFSAPALEGCFEQRVAEESIDLAASFSLAELTARPIASTLGL